MHLLSILGIVTLSLSGFSTALAIEGEPNVNGTLVQQHLRDREKLIALEKTHRQGVSHTIFYLSSPSKQN
jgi:adenosine deaminase CECR1